MHVLKSNPINISIFIIKQSALALHVNRVLAVH